MKLIEKPINVVESDIFDSVSFGIKQSGLPYIFNILRNQLYSNKPLAVLREISCNAQDANIEAGSKRPIEVKLPNKLDPTLTIRDFGNGLSPDDIKNLYCYYGESTKRESNSAIGYYGIGKFAPFSYGDNFVLISYHNGKKTTYNAFIDETKIGKIVKLKEEKSSEPTGVVVSVPIREQDMMAFLKTAVELFKYFKNKPKITGVRKEDVAPIYDRKPVFEGSCWRYYGGRDRPYYHSSSSVAVMGVGYDIDTSGVDFKITDLASLCNQGFEVDFNLGELDITASRESLEYTDKTKKAIRAKFKKVKEEIAESITNQFKISDNIFDAKALYHEVFGTYGSLGYVIRDSLNNKVTWNSKVINDQIIPFTDKVRNLISTGKVTARFYSKSRRSSKLVSESEQTRFVCEKGHKILINDTGSAMGVTLRLATLWNQLGEAIDGAYVLAFKDDADKVLFNKEIGLIEKNYLKLSDYEKIEIQKVTSGNSVVSKNLKHSSQIFKFKRDDARSWGTKSSNWETMSINLASDSAIYVEINNFEARSKDDLVSLGNGSLKDALDQFESFTGEKITDLYGIKSKTFQSKKKVIKKNKNLVSLWDYMQDKLQVEFDKTAQKIIDAKHWEQHQNENDGDDFVTLVERIQKHKLHEAIEDNNNSFSQYLSAVIFYTKSDFKKVSEVQNFLKNAHFDIKFKDVKPTYNLISLIKDVREKYGLLDLFVPESYGWKYDSKDKLQKIIEYINLIDKN
jgi:hypothetical protein